MEKQSHHRKASEIHLHAFTQPEEKPSNAQIWQENKEKIIDAVEFLVMNNLKLYVSNIAKQSNLSATTIYNHLDTIGNSADPNEEPLSTEFKLLTLMKDRVLEKVCALAREGDHKSAKLFLTIMEKPKPVQKVTNNYMNTYNSIIFKGVAVTEKALQRLPPEIQTTIVTLIKEYSEKENEKE